MRIEKISDSIIRVTVSMNDLEERNIDFNELTYNTPAAQEFIWDMMEQAEELFGFNLSDSQLIIEPVPDSNNGFSITITRIDEDGDFESIQKYIKSRLRKSDLRVKKRSRRVCSTLFMYSFQGMDDICRLAKRLDGIYSGDSTLYRCRGAYYLTLTRSGIALASTKLFELIISEYGTKITNVNFYEGYLNEYGEKIIDSNALELLRQYFS